MSAQRKGQPEPALTRLSEDVLALTEGFVRNQFSSMGRLTDDGGPVPESRSTDPEAVLAFSFELSNDLPALKDPTVEWLSGCGSLLNLNRLRYLGTRDFELPPNSTKSSGHTGILERFPPVNLAFRLRCIFGVSCKAEVLRVLLGATDRTLSIDQLAGQVALSNRQVRREVLDLKKGGLVLSHPGRLEERFSLDIGMWSGFLGFQGEMLPDFIHWPNYLRACSGVLDWLRSADSIGVLDRHRLMLSTESLLESLRRPFGAVAGPGPSRPVTDDQYWSEFADYILLGFSLLDDY